MEHELRAVLPESVRVIPLILDDEGAETLPGALQRVQWVDFSRKVDMCPAGEGGRRTWINDS